MQSSHSPGQYISIHSLRMEGDICSWVSSRQFRISIHSLRMEGDSRIGRRPHDVIISIHSLRMEGDVHHFKRLVSVKEFQSTPSAWRETCKRGEINVSILYFNPLPPHGGRPSLRSTIIPSFHFNPLPPHGGRHDSACPFPGRRKISIHSLRMEGDSKTAQESVFHFAYPCTILQKRMQKTTFCTRKNGFFRKKGEKFGAKPSASFCAPMIRTDTFPLNFSHRISGSSMSMVSFAPICSTFD